MTTVWVVTGANSGIGLALTQILLASGDNLAVVVGVDKDTEELENIETENLVVFKCDLQDTEQILELFHKIGQHPRAGRVDVLVNNVIFDIVYYNNL